MKCIILVAGQAAILEQEIKGDVTGRYGRDVLLRTEQYFHVYFQCAINSSK